MTENNGLIGKRIEWKMQLTSSQINTFNSFTYLLACPNYNTADFGEARPLQQNESK